VTNPTDNREHEWFVPDDYLVQAGCLDGGGKESDADSVLLTRLDSQEWLSTLPAE